LREFRDELKPNDFIDLIEPRLAPLFHFVFRITNSTEEAERIVYETALRAYHGREKLPANAQLDAWLYKIALHIAESRRSNTEHLTFDYLDDMIRSDPTLVTRTGYLADPERNLLLWELKQGCMTAVLNCLSLGERAAFVLAVMLDIEAADAAATLGVTPAALKVRLSRAKKKIVDYLAPRCEHVHPTNPCHCPSRLGVALRKGFIRTTPGATVMLRPMKSDSLKPAAPVRDVVTLYQHLPAPAIPPALVERLRRECQDGVWDRLEG
jgi:DNA-directed RNA polymerase specialized sigma24 family protein